MLINKLLYSKLLDENDGEGNDLGGGPAIEGEGEAPQEPSYLFGDVTADEAADRFGYLRELPDQLRGLEGRVSDTVTPVMEQLQSFGEKLGSQPAFEPKLERTIAALREYDPKLADLIEPVLAEELKGSMSITPLGPETLEPHISPMLQQAQQAVVDQMMPALLDSLSFDADAIVNRDPANPDSVLAPETELQKDFAKWWEQADAPTRKALGTLGVPYVGALQRFGKWRAELLRKKGQEAGAASTRLSRATQGNSGGRREPASSGLKSESDGFNAIFSEERS